jgi:thiol-disulfide isomerase/thioredoxin
VPIRPEYQTQEPGHARNTPPRVVIPSPTLAPTSPWAGTAVGASGKVPYCTVAGNRVIDFALLDLNGQPFHFTQHQGKLVLLDFWGSWCTSCIQGLPHLADLQRRYGAAGLEVIGVAYEEGTHTEQVQKINFLRNRHGVRYKIILGDGDNCPLLTQLGVKEYPTLILLDQRGTILWRGEGLSSQNKARLEAELRSRLGER